MPIGWQRKTIKLEEAIAEERAKLDIAKRQWLPVSAPFQPVTTQLLSPTPFITERQEPLIPSRLPVSDDYTPPELPITNNVAQQLPQRGINIPTMGNQPEEQIDRLPVSADYQPPQLPETKETALWKQPAAITEKVMTGIGQGISKIPGAPQALGFAAPVFDWIHKSLELPFAATLTASLSPTLEWKQGETWLEHQKREYETWKAPTYVKGLAEFAMPLWWIPYFGWAGKGAKALGASTKVLSGIEKAGAVVSLKMPTDKLLNQVLYKHDFYKSMAMWAKDKPVFHQAFRAINPSVFIDATSQEPTEIVRRAIGNSLAKRSWADSLKNDLPNRLQQYGGGDVVKVMDVDIDSLVKTAVPKVPNSSRRLVDILEHPKDYTFSSVEAQNVVNEFTAIRKQLKDMVVSDMKERYRDKVITQAQYQTELKAFTKSWQKVHRNVLGIMDENGKFIESKWGSNPALERVYDTQEEAVQAHLKKGQKIVYGNDPVEILQYEIDRATNRIIQKNLTPVFSQVGKTAQEKFATLFPEVATDLKNLGNKQIAAQYALDTAQRIISYKGVSIPGATLKKIEEALPDVANQLRQVLALKPESVDRVLSSISRALRSELKINAKELKTMLVKSADIALAFKAVGTKPTISMSDIDMVVSNLNLSKQLKAKIITTGYRITAQENKQIFQDFMKANRDTLKQIVVDTKAQLTPLKQKRWEFLKGYASKEKLVGIGGKTTERTVPFFNHIPELRGKFYDDKVAKVIEKQYGDLGSKLSRQLGTFGAMSRNLTLALDNSVMFIQGQSLLGRNPLLWVKTLRQQLDFIVHPENFAKYMADPARQVLHNEMRNAGMSIAPFEIVEASPLIAKALKKSPVLSRIYKETYGRGEVMFTSYGQLAKDNLWSALRKPNMSQSELFELGRTLDRMTGVMSTEAIGVGRTQRDIESAWLFLTPRYTRASLAYIGDVMKGGISGAEARKSLGMLMAGGMTMYIGTMKMTGQTPNLNPKSSRFMTVRVGDSYIGIGGSMYTLMRLSANVVATTSDPETRGELSPLNFSRVDNPFYKYLYSKTSPLTGTLVQLMEQKNYMGEPFENIGDWGQFLLDKVTPIAAQQIYESKSFSPIVGASVFLGARTFPAQTWELQDDARDIVSQEKYQLPYDRLDLIQKELVDKSPQVTSFQSEIDKQTTIRDKTISMGFLNRRRELESANADHKESIENLQKQYDLGLITGFDFKEGVKSANTGYGATYEHINSNPEYKDVLKKLQEPKDVSRAYRWELAYDELMIASSTNQFVDQYGIFDFTKYNQFLDSLKSKYGEADFNRAMEKKNLKYAEYPPLFQEYQKAKEILKPYWGVTDQVVRLFGQRYADSKSGQALISKRKKQMRLRNPELNRVYEKFYASK